MIIDPAMTVPTCAFFQDKIGMNNIGSRLLWKPMQLQFFNPRLFVSTGLQKGYSWTVDFIIEEGS